MKLKRHLMTFPGIVIYHSVFNHQMTIYKYSNIPAIITVKEASFLKKVIITHSHSFSGDRSENFIF